jgi:plastocyanin
MRRILLATVCAAGVMHLPGTTAIGAAQSEDKVTGRAVVSGRPAADVVVWLDAPGAPRAPETRLVIEQRNMQFTPRVMAARVGSTIELPNNDRVFHNVFSFNHGKPFDLGLYPTGATKRITLDRPAVNRLYCNIHPHMAAYIVAVDTPYFATTNKAGAFTIPGVPAGEYTYHAWRSGGETRVGTAMVGENAPPLEIRWR